MVTFAGGNNRAPSYHIFTTELSTTDCRSIQCLSDAETALQKFSQGWKYHKILAKAEPITKYAQPGRPSASDKPEIVGYHLLGTIAVADDAFQNAKKSLGKFIIATNQLDTAKLPAKTMLEHYTKQGVSVERGFRFLKDPLFFAHSLFLKKTERIMALIMIMVLSLLIYALAERQLIDKLIRFRTIKILYRTKLTIEPRSPPRAPSFKDFLRVLRVLGG